MNRHHAVASTVKSCPLLDIAGFFVRKLSRLSHVFAWNHASPANRRPSCLEIMLLLQTAARPVWKSCFSCKPPPVLSGNHASPANRRPSCLEIMLLLQTAARPVWKSCFSCKPLPVLFGNHASPANRCPSCLEIMLLLQTAARPVWELVDCLFLGT
jgi:hypothetical protein